MSSKLLHHIGVKHTHLCPPRHRPGAQAPRSCGAAPVISPAGALASSPFPSFLRLIWLTISLPWPCATYGNVRQEALYRSQKRSAEAFLSGKSIFAGMPFSGQQACHRPLYGSGSAYQAQNHHSLSATVFANLRLTSHAWSGRRTYTRPSA